jgi:hypothetical protein
MARTLAALCVAIFAVGAAGAACAAEISDKPPDGYPAIAAIVKGGGCAPKDNTARILKSAHPLDYAPTWNGANTVGTAWTFMPKRYAINPDIQGGIFLEGHLITTRGAEMPDDLFVLFAEWDCAH